MSLLLLLSDDAPNPRSLFAAGEQGIWLDPSDFSTLFQDAAGTTPVTALGQPVGLALDKRLGLVLGPEMVTNGNFDTDLTGWTQSTADYWVVSSGRAYHAPSAAYNELKWTFTGATKAYKVTLDMEVIGGNAQVFWATNPVTTTGIISKGAGVHRISFIVTGGISSVGFSRAGTVTEVYVDNITVKELPGNHAYQTTSASRPTLQQDSNGMYYLSFDGTDDGMATPSIDFTGTDKMTVWAGVRKLSDAARAVVLELGAGISVKTFNIEGPASASPSFSFRNAGSGLSTASAASGYPAPTTSVLTGIGAISTDTCILRVNGTQVASDAADQGTGNYGNYPLYIGRRGGTSLPFNGRIYQLILRGAESNAGQIAATEAYVNAKTRAY